MYGGEHAASEPSPVSTACYRISPCTYFSYVSVYFFLLSLLAFSSPPSPRVFPSSLSSNIQCVSHLSVLCPSIKDPALLPYIQPEMWLQDISHCQFGMRIPKHSIRTGDEKRCCHKINRETSAQPPRTAFSGPFAHTCLSFPVSFFKIIACTFLKQMYSLTSSINPQLQRPWNPVLTGLFLHSDMSISLKPTEQFSPIGLLFRPTYLDHLLAQTFQTKGQFQGSCRVIFRFVSNEGMYDYT